MTFGGRLSHDIEAGISHFIATDIPVWLLRRNRDVNVTNVRYKFVHPKWLLDSLKSGKLLDEDSYRLRGDIEKNVLDFPARPSPVDSPRVPPAPSLVKPPLEKKSSSDLNAPRGMLSAEDNPNFVRDYFNNSRLHHLSSWKVKFQERLANFLAQKGISDGTRQATVDLDNRFIVHLDMDAFFVTVTLLHYPQYRDKPCVVAHGGDHSEISSCNYHARQKGIRNGMWLAEAKRLCPEVVIVPYMFDAYEEVSKKVFSILVKYTTCIQVKSCDEALLEMSHLGEHEKVLEAVHNIRSEVHRETSCNISAGIASNILLARLALKKAKPNGIVSAPTLASGKSVEEIMSWISQFKLEDIPSVGRSTNHELKESGIVDVSRLQSLSRDQLMKMLGKVNGMKLYDFVRGIDPRPVEVVKQRKSIAVEVNYALRFTSNEKVSKFVFEVAEEVQRRMVESNNVQGRKVTVTVMRKKAGAKEPSKFLGHGWCDTFSRSGALASPSNDAAVIGETAWELYKQIECPPAELRGFGIHLGDLEDETGAKLSKVRKRDVVSASQQTLASLILSKNRLKEDHADLKRKRRAESPQKAPQAQQQNDSSDGELEADDVEAIFADDHERVDPQPAKKRARIEPPQPLVTAPMVLIRTGATMFSHVRLEDIELSLYSALSSESPNLATAELLIQLIQDWIEESFLEDVTALLRMLQSFNSNPEWVPLLEGLRSHSNRLALSIFGSCLF